MIHESAVSLLAVLLLLAANGFFVAAEFALVKARGVRIESLAGEGGYAAKLTLRIQSDLEAYLAACQLGITMASLGLGWVGEPAVAALLRPLLLPTGLSEAGLHTISFLLGFTLFSSLHIVLGEQVPKTFAIRNPEPVSVLCAIPLRFFFLLFFPLNWLLNWISRGILKLLGVAEAPHSEVLTGTEIQGLVQTSAEHGHLGEEKAQMIHNLFRFDERTVGRVMIPRVECEVLNLDQTPAENIAVMKETKHSRFPVVEGAPEKLVGIVLMKELVDALLGGEPEPWADLRSYCREPLVVPETLKVPRLFDTMREEKAHMACVIDAASKVCRSNTKSTTSSGERSIQPLCRHRYRYCPSGVRTTRQVWGSSAQTAHASSLAMPVCRNIPKVSASKRTLASCWARAARGIAASTAR